MCGRYTLTFPDLESLAATLGATFEAEAASTYRPHFNAAPGTAQIVLRPQRSVFGARELVQATWGLRSPSDLGGRGPVPINARSETVRERGMFRTAFESRRCVVPATGFYEWVGPKSARRPVWFHPPGGGLLHFAGLYAESPGAGGEGRSFTILTTAANEVVAGVHHRMPVILDPRDIDRWLDGAPEEAAALLVPAPRETLTATEVSARANSVENDDPACLDPWSPSEAPQLSLFG